VTIHRGTAGGGGVTSIGDHNVFMAYAHVAHDCHVGSHTIFGNAATLGGHVTVEDYATISAFSGVHQFCRVGLHAFIGGYSVITKDALPFAKSVGNRARLYGLNTIGLVRRKFSRTRSASCGASTASSCTRTRAARSRGSRRIQSLQCAEVQYVVQFIRSSSRGVGMRRPSRRVDEGDE
jgi:UDP-N-acetylglucosamine acyltransferase